MFIVVVTNDVFVWIVKSSRTCYVEIVREIHFFILTKSANLVGSVLIVYNCVYILTFVHFHNPKGINLFVPIPYACILENCLLYTAIR
jgi:hypothetical protein